MFDRVRIKYAFRFGRTEHFFGRAIVIPIILQMAYSYIEKEYIVEILAYLTFLCWFFYYLSHRSEKALYGQRFKRR